MNNLKLECLKLAVDHCRENPNATTDVLKHIADIFYDYCKDGESNNGMNEFEKAEFERKCSGDWLPPMTREQYLKGEDITMPKKDK